MAYVREDRRPDARLRGTHTTVVERRDAGLESPRDQTLERDRDQMLARDRERYEQTREREYPRAEKATLGAVTGGASFETLAGATAVVLAILALAGIAPFTLAGIATIAIGCALLAFGLAIAARWRETLRTKEGRAEAGTASGVDMLAGAAGIVLGVLVLVGTMPELMLAISAIVFGGALLIGAVGQTQLASATYGYNERFDKALRRTMKGAGGIMVVVGAGAIVLAILGLLGFGTLFTMSVIALLAIGAALVVSGLATASEFGYRLKEAT